MTKRKKVIIILIIFLVLIAAGVLIWAFKTGKLKPMAESVPFLVVSGHVDNLPTFPLSVKVQAGGYPQGEVCPNEGGAEVDSQGNYSIALQDEGGCSATQVKLEIILLDVSIPSVPYATDGTFIKLQPFQRGQNFTANLNYSNQLHGYAVDKNYAGIGGAVVKTNAGTVLATTDNNGFFKTNLASVDGVYVVLSSGSKLFFGKNSNFPGLRYVPAIFNNALITGTVRGQHSDSQNQLSLHLAKVETTINGKKYYTRTDAQGNYTLDFSDQTTLPTTPITITASADTESFESQDQQVTLSQSNTLDFTLGRQVSEEWVAGLTDPADYIALNSVSSQMTTASTQNTLLPSAHAQTVQTRTVKGKVIGYDPSIEYNNDTARVPIQGAKVNLSVWDEKDEVKILPDVQATTDANGYYSLTTPIPDGAHFLIDAWKEDNSYLMYEEKWNPETDECKPAIVDTDCLDDIELTKLSANSLIGGIKFLAYGGEAKSTLTTQQKRLANIATIVTNLKTSFKVKFPQEIAISDRGFMGNVGLLSTVLAAASIDIEGQNPFIIYPTSSLSENDKEIVSMTIHETGHVIQYLKFYKNQNLMNDLQAHKQAKKSYYDNFTLVKDNLCGVKDGHPDDNYTELFASSFGVFNVCPQTFLKLIISTDQAGISAFTPDQKNASYFIMDLIETRKQHINGKTLGRNVFGLPLNLAKTYSVQDILAGKYP